MNFILPKLNVSIERWKFNPEYKVWVSNMGNFKDINKQPIKPKIGQNGYVSIRVLKNGKKFYGNHYEFGHRLVMKTWKPITNPASMTVDHINHNKRDNRLTNLEWVTAKENLRRANEDLISPATSTKSIKGVKNFFIDHPEMKEYFSMSINGFNSYKTLSFNTPEEAATYLKEKVPALKNNNQVNIDHIAKRIILAAINDKAAYNYNWGFQKEGE